MLSLLISALWHLHHGLRTVTLLLRSDNTPTQLRKAPPEPCYQNSFASGLIYGLMTFGDAQQAVNYGVVHGALAMTTPGDTSMASLKEVEAKVHGAGARVQR